MNINIKCVKKRALLHGLVSEQTVKYTDMTFDVSQGEEEDKFFKTLDTFLTKLEEGNIDKIVIQKGEPWRA